MNSKSHFTWIDFLRGISAFGIVLYHVRVDLWVGWVAISTQPESFSFFDRAVALLSIPIPFLRPSVMLFFLVSGFGIHYSYSALGRLWELKSYSIRRLLRIYPPYIAAVIGCILIEWILRVQFNQEVSPIAKVWQTVFMVQNYSPDAGQMYTNPALWSLPIEVELYVAYPIFYWLLRRYGIKWSMFAVAIVSIGALVIALGPNLQNYNNTLVENGGHFAVYWIIWCAGALLAEWTGKDKLPKWQPWWWGVMALTFVIGIAVTLLKLFIVIQELIWGGFYFTLMLWGMTQPDPLGFLSDRMKKIFSFLGLISYSLYLINYPLFRLCGEIWLSLFGTKPANFLIPLLFSVLCIPIAYAFYLAVEAPSYRLAKKLANPGRKPRTVQS
ncbi:acyltransferase family protein [Allocoleopsis franciscana]|uniref:Putative acyltransferase n=1 Tax=Allocoleopsis franciscana PCC 7113 TaxID=1173027 RepID=K9W895_9CYAN|nr:acyltransferase [Allocoleopsis franciscana]AFZ16046.1 putative acyltransferase [Allocoleopsis franciscana PCC 7113]